MANKTSVDIRCYFVRRRGNQVELTDRFRMSERSASISIYYDAMKLIFCSFRLYQQFVFVLIQCFSDVVFLFESIDGIDQVSSSIVDIDL